MPSVAAEDYLKELYSLEQGEEGDYVRTNALAGALGVTAGTATAMVQGLAREGLVDYRMRVGSRLSPEGRREALRMVRRHRLIEAFLVDVLGLDWSEVHEEAHRLEHAVSDRVTGRMEAMLGYPSADPHGDPIPTAGGSIERGARLRLADAPRGRALRVARILDQDPAFLRFLAARGLGPGTVVTLEEADEGFGALTLRSSDGAAATLSIEAAGSILVERPGRSSAAGTGAAGSRGSGS